MLDKLRLTEKLLQHVHLWLLLIRAAAWTFVVVALAMDNRFSDATSTWGFHLGYLLLAMFNFVHAQGQGDRRGMAAQFHFVDIIYFAAAFYRQGSPASNLQLCFALPLLSASVLARPAQLLRTFAMLISVITVLLVILIVRSAPEGGVFKQIIFIVVPRIGFWACMSAPLFIMNASADRLQEMKLYYHSLLEGIPQMVFRKDASALLSRDDKPSFSKFTYANSAFCNNLGKSERQVIGFTDADFFPPHLADLYRLDDMAILKGDVPRIEKDEMHHSPHTKATVQVRVVKTPIKEEDGKITGLQCMFWTTGEGPEERDRMLRWFLHDTPKPLHVVRDKHIEKIRSLARKTEIDRKNLDYYAGLIADIVQFVSAQFEAYGILSTDSLAKWNNRNEVAISQAFKRYADLLLMDHQYISLSWDCDPKDLTIVTDECKLIAVFWNFMENAVKSVKMVRDMFLANKLPVGTVPEDWVGTIKVSFRREHDTVILQVVDNGMGFDQSGQQAITELKARNFINSTGLGLQIVAHFARASKGDWNVSSPGWYKGATFRFEFPLQST